MIRLQERAMPNIRLCAGLIGTVLAVLALATPASAQNSEDSNLVCGQYKDDTERLKCLNQLLDMLMRARGGQPIPELDSVNRPSAPATNATSATARKATPPPSGDAFGLPADKTDTADDKRRTIRVISAKKDITGLFYFKTDDGQVWKQTGRKRFQVPNGEFDAEISKGRFGGYQLRVADVAGFLRVKRLK